jgi:hydrogenase maturation factor
MAIAGGQTRVTKAVTEPVAVVSGLGKAPVGTDHSARAAAPGQDVVISKWIGLEGTALLARRHREKCLERYPAYLVDEAAGFERYLSLMREAATAVKSGVCAMHDASEGGIFGALWELAEGAGVGLDIDLKKLPLRQETVEVCELCGVNPYELLSGGCLVMTSFDGPGLAAALEAEQIPAAVVGKVTKGPGRILRNDGEERFMDRPKQDALYGAGADMEDINKTDERQDHQV